jgi:glycosyltransferase involved in cell wall biosynthesis
MKVALIIGRLERGGSERQIVEFVLAAHPDHARCVVICLGDEGPLAEKVRGVGASVVALGARRLYSPRSLWGLARALRDAQPDVVYAFLFWGYSISLPLAALVVPAACRIQGRRSLPDVDVPSRPIFRWLRWIAARCSHGVIANSIAVGSAVARQQPVLAGRLWVVHNGVRSVRRAPRPAGREVVVVCIANLIAYKGHATLLTAASRLRPDHWRMLLVGDGPERESIERMIAARDLEGRVTLLGRLADVDAVLATAHIVVLPSLSEGLPNAVLEGMAHGLPVVGSDVGGVRGLLGSGAGVVVAPGDEVALAEALQRLIDDQCLRESMGEAGRQLAQGSLGIDAMRDATLNAISDICQQRRGHARIST